VWGDHAADSVSGWVSFWVNDGIKSLKKLSNVLGNNSLSLK